MKRNFIYKVLFLMLLSLVICINFKPHQIQAASTNLYTIAPGSSVLITSTVTTSTTIYITGNNFDYVKYDDDGDVVNYGQDTVSDTNTVSLGQRVIYTNTGSGNVKIEAKSRPLMMEFSTNPALRKLLLAPNQSVAVVNNHGVTENIEVGGVNDYAKYGDYNEVSSFAANDAAGSMSIPAGEMAVVTNRETSAFYVYGAYESFTFTTRSSPAVFHSLLDQGETVQLVSFASKSFAIKLEGGKYEYAIYDDAGELDSYAQSSLGVKTVYAGETFIVTNLDAETLDVMGPTDGFTVSSRANPALQTKTLTSGASVRVKNIADATSTLNLEGTYDYAEYDASGEVTDYDKGVSLSTNSIAAGGYIDITPASTGTVKVIGPADYFQMSDRTNPALYKTTITPGSTMEAVNISGEFAGFTLDGYFDYALFEIGEGITSYKSFQNTGTLQVHGLGRLAFTNKESSSKSIYAPYDAFVVTTRANPVTYEYSLAPGETIMADNTSNNSFTLAAGGQHHYVIYDNGNEVSEMGRPTVNDSYSITDSEALVITNSGTTTWKLSGPRDAFLFTVRANPALLKTYLPSSSSLKLTSTSTTEFEIDLTGTYDQASYLTDGKARSFDRKTDIAYLSLYEGERVTLTNSGSELLQIIVPYDVTQVENNTSPALALRTLTSGQSAEFSNTTQSSEKIEFTGIHDLMEYDVTDVPVVYTRDTTLSYVYINAGTHIAVENSGTTVMEAYGPYERVTATNRSLPVTFKRTLQPGEGIDLTNQSSKSFTIYPNGIYDYAVYDKSGDASDVQLESALDSKSVSSGNRLALTNSDSSAIVVEGPQDIFGIQTRTNPALFKTSLSPGKSMEATYKGAEEGDVHMTDEYDYALYTSYGKLSSYARNQTINSRQAVQKNEKIAIENSYTSSITVYGSYDLFDTNLRTEPVTFKKTLSPGQSFEATNKTDKLFYVYLDGAFLYDYVLFDSSGVVSDLDRKSATSSKTISSGKRIAFTNSYPTAITITGAYDAYTLTDRTNPVLFVRQLAPGASMEATNKSQVAADVYASGLYDYAMYANTGAFTAYGHEITSSGHQTVEPGNKVAFQNSDTTSIEIYGVYDYFQSSNRTNPVTFSTTLGPDDNIDLNPTSTRQLYIYLEGSYDYAKYDMDGEVVSYNTWGSSGSLLLAGDYRMHVSPSEAQTINISGSYDGFKITPRDERAVTVKKLEPGQDISFRNISPSAFGAKISGLYDYQVYSLLGAIESFGTDSSLSVRTLSPSKRLVVTNADTVVNTVTLPTDAIQITNGNGTDQFVKGIESGDSIKAKNTSSSGSVLTVDGLYDIAVYTGAGNPVSYTKGSNAVSVSIPAGHYAVLTSRQVAGTVISGSLSAFDVTEQEEPALKLITPGNGNTIELQTTSVVSFNVTFDGMFSWVKYDSGNTALDFAREVSRPTLTLSTNQRLVITSDRLDGLQIWGPYNVLQSVASEQPALTEAELDAGSTLTATNLTDKSKILKTGGAFSYRIGKSGDQTGTGQLEVLAKGTAYLKNTTGSEYVVYAPYGHFNFVAGGNVSGSISGKSAADKIAKLDPADYDAQSFHADPIDTATGAQIINRTLITANGSVPIPFQAQYHSLLNGEGALGQNWSHNFEIRLASNETGDSVKIYWNAFRGNTFLKGQDGQYTSTESAASRDKLNKQADGSFELRRNDGTIYHFDQTGKLVEMAGKTGERLIFGYNQDEQLSTISDPLTDAKLTLGYDTSAKLTKVTDQAGREASFAYDSDGRLSVITDPMNRQTVYTYDADNRIESAATDDVQLFKNEFDNEDRVIKQNDAIVGHTATLFQYEQIDDSLVTTITDRNGNIQKRTHDSNYRLLSVEDANGHVTSFGYSSLGDRTSVKNTLGQTTTFDYDAKGNLIGATDFTGQSMIMTYDGSNNLLTATGPDGITTTNTYDSDNRLLTVEVPGTGVTTFSYNSNGLLESATDPEEGITQYNYTGNRLTGITNAEGESTSFGYDAAGRMVTETAEGHTTTLSYNAGDELISSTNPLGQSYGYSYDNQGFLTSTTNAKGKETSYGYDANGNLISVTNALNETTSLVYDGEGRLLSITDPLDRVLSYTYDAVGNVLTESNSNGEQSRYVYDSLNRLKESYDSKNNKVYSATYDNAGNLQSVADALNHSYTYEYDGLNRLTGIVDPLQRQTSFGYDQLSRLKSVTDPLEGQSKQSYDTLSRISGVEDPNQNAAVYNYDLVGRIISETNAAGGSQSYTYNALGLLNKSTDEKGQDTTYTYDDAGRLAGFSDQAGSVTYTYDANGNVTSVTDGNGKTLLREFDELDRVTQYVDEDGNAISYAYNEAGELTSLTYPDGKVVTYTYDAAGRMKTVTDWDDRVTTYDYDANGQLISTIRPDGSIETREYDVKGQLLAVTDKNADGTVIYSADYDYNQVGNLKSENIGSGEVVTSNGSGQPVAIDLNGPGLSPALTDSNLVTHDMTYGADNRLHTYNGQEVSFDANGNMTFGPLDGSMHDYDYDARNRLTEAGGVSYGYNSENERTSVQVDGETTKYVINPHAILSQVLMETDGQGQAKAWYVYGLGLICREDTAGNYLTYHYDRRGSTIALTNELGQVNDTYQYGNFGEAKGHVGESEQPFRYNGRDGVMTDPNGLYQMRARYYNPEIKRFINRDVLAGSIGDGQTLNRYAYVNGNPVSYVDPFGLSRDGDSIWLQGGDFLLDVVPFVGTVKGFQQAFTGMNYVTGERLSVADRWAEGIGATLSVVPIPGLKYLGKYGTEGVVRLADEVTEQTTRKLYLDLDLQLFGDPKYQVGLYNEIKGAEGLDAHHVGQKAIMRKMVKNYDEDFAPAINVPKVGHTIKGPNGIVSRSSKGINNPRQLLARDINELRRVYDDIPNSALKELIALNKEMYPEMREKLK